MTIFHAIAPDGTRERLRFETQAEADAVADRYREAGHSLYWIVWAESLQRWVSIPEDGPPRSPAPPRAAPAAGARRRRRAMMLSANGDDPMPKLSDTQLVILSAAAQRADLSVLPLPDTLKLKGGALAKVMDSLRNRGLIRVLGGDGGPERAVITSEGMAAIGIETEDDAPEGATPADTDATAAEPDSAADGPAPATEANGAAVPARGKAKAKAAKAAPLTSEPEAASGAAEKPTPPAGTKQALMIDLLKRPEGATVEQIAAATGWQHHTIRGAISGALKKKLGLTVEATRTREVGPNKTGAKGSSTVYRIVGSGTETA